MIWNFLCEKNMAYPVKRFHTLGVVFQCTNRRGSGLQRMSSCGPLRVSFLNNPQSDNFPLVMQTRRAFEPAPAFSRAIVPLPGDSARLLLQLQLPVFLTALTQ